MAQQFDIGLNASINEFVKKFGITKNEQNEADIFEDFGNYIVVSNLLEKELEGIKSVSTNKAKGIDGVAILVNSQLISEESDLKEIGQNEPIKIKIGFIQSTTQSSFDGKKFGDFIDTVVEFLINKISIEPFSTIYKKLFDDKDGFINRMKETPLVTLFFISGKTSHKISNDDINNQKNKITLREDLKYRCKLENINFFQTEEIKKQYNNIAKFHKTTLEFEESIQLPEINDIKISLLTTIKFSQLKKLILTPDGNLRQSLFVENIRNYIGDTEVNKSIKKTLEDENKKCYFPFLNNGLVIICDEIERHPTKPKFFTLTFPRIINGCQTTNELFKQYSDKNKNLSDDIMVVIKILATKNNQLKRDIIICGK
ncbi:AIPR family protein [Helicobacter cetorum]|uniref:AIPR family protein n=1 Tax=Helicobacter cetorum TaxID=138563 RepID=UPI0018F82E11|nr:AIPR family protein [Helicobacter cetorum]